jgi:hypothetical protein
MHIPVVQLTKGVSVVKVLAKVVLKSSADLVLEQQAAADAALEAGEEPVVPDIIPPTDLFSGELAIEWSDDPLV